MYKIVNNMVPEYLSSRFVFCSDTLTYNLRGSDGTLAIPQPRTNRTTFCSRLSHAISRARAARVMQKIAHNTRNSTLPIPTINLVR